MKKYYLIISIFLLFISLLNFFIKFDLKYLILLISVINFILIIKYRLNNFDIQKGIWLFDFATGYYIYEIIVINKTTLIGCIFIILGLLFFIEYKVMNRKEKNE